MVQYFKYPARGTIFYHFPLFLTFPKIRGSNSSFLRGPRTWQLNFVSPDSRERERKKEKKERKIECEEQTDDKGRLRNRGRCHYDESFLLGKRR